MKFLSIDFETANDSLLSACAIGAAYFENMETSNTSHSLIKPPLFHKKLKTENFNIHKIDYSEYSKSKNFKTIWFQLVEQLQIIENDETHFVCFNAIFDLSVLMNLTKKYNIKKNFVFYDPMEIAKHIWPDRESYSLKNLSKDFDIELNHHNPLSDAIAAGRLVIKQLEITNASSLEEILNKYSLEFIKTDLNQNGFYDHYGNFKQAAKNFQEIKKK